MKINVCLVKYILLMFLYVNKMLEFCGNLKIFGFDNKFEIESKLLGKFNFNVLLKMFDFFFKICGNMLKVFILFCYFRFFI